MMMMVMVGMVRVMIIALSFSYVIHIIARRVHHPVQSLASHVSGRRD